MANRIDFHDEQRRSSSRPLDPYIKPFLLGIGIVAVHYGATGIPAIGTLGAVVIGASDLLTRVITNGRRA